MNIARNQMPVPPAATECRKHANSPAPSAAAARLDAQAVNTGSDANGLGIEWRTKRQIARHLKCSVRHINKLMKRRVLPFLKMGRFVRFDVAACDLALKRIEVKSVLG
jgi:excisionase family DNA binding protein